MNIDCVEIIKSINQSRVVMVERSLVKGCFQKNVF